MLTLIPPPVDPDAGPMNIRMVVTVIDSGLSACVSSAAKPALRGVIEANSEFTTLSTSPSGPSVRGFDHSTIPMTTAAGDDQHDGRDDHELGLDGEGPPATAIAQVAGDHEPETADHDQQRGGEQHQRLAREDREPAAAAHQVEARVVEGARRVEDRLPHGVRRIPRPSGEGDHEQEHGDADDLDGEREGDRPADDVPGAAQRAPERVDHGRPGRERGPPAEQHRQRGRRHDPEAADRDQDGDRQLAPERPVVGRVDDGEARVRGRGHRREQRVDGRGPLPALARDRRHEEQRPDRDERREPEQDGRRRADRRRPPAGRDDRRDRVERASRRPSVERLDALRRQPASDSR